MSPIRNQSLHQRGVEESSPADPLNSPEGSGRDEFEMRESDISLLEPSGCDEKGGADHR